MTNSEPPNSSASRSSVEPGNKQKLLFSKTGAWLKELRFWIAVAIIFAGIIEYKARFSTQNGLVDILAFGLISSFVASVVAGIPVHRTITRFVRTVFEVPWS